MPDFSDLKQTYAGRCVLDIPELSLRDGGGYAILGANGAGKSTLLQLLTDRLRSRREPDRLGSLPQKPYAFSLSVHQNIELGIPAGASLNRAERNALVVRQLHDFGLEPLASQRADRLSGGETQKLALARLLVVPRRILLLDEPTSSMDLNGMQLAAQAIARYRAEHPGLLLLVSHQTALLRLLTEEALFLDRGCLAERGPTEDLLSHPRNGELRRLLQMELGAGGEEEGGT